MKNSKFVGFDFFRSRNAEHQCEYAECSPADKLLPDCNPDKNILL